MSIPDEVLDALEAVCKIALCNSTTDLIVTTASGSESASIHVPNYVMRYLLNLWRAEQEAKAKLREAVDKGIEGMHVHVDATVVKPTVMDTFEREFSKGSADETPADAN